MKKQISLALISTVAGCTLFASQAFADVKVSGRVSEVTQSGYNALIQEAGIPTTQNWHLVITGGGFALAIDPPHPFCN